MSRMTIVAGTFNTIEDIVGWVIIALLMIPITLLIALPFLTTASHLSSSSPLRMFRFDLGGGFAALGIAIGYQLYWHAMNDLPALAW